MTTPRFVDCKCGHPKVAHQIQHAGMCIIGGCECLERGPASRTRAGGT